jgi:hypothetical protein
MISYVHSGGSPEEQWYIALPQQMLEGTVAWFRQVMGHPGKINLHETLQQCYQHPKLRYTLEEFKCDHCQ